MPDVYDIDPRHPKFETSREPKYKTLTFIGEVEDDLEDFCKYKFTGNYYEFEGKIRFVESSVSVIEEGILFPVLGYKDWLWILLPAISEELKIEVSEIIFESQIQFK